MNTSRQSSEQKPKCRPRRFLGAGNGVPHRLHFRFKGSVEAVMTGIDLRRYVERESKQKVSRKTRK
jgi:hypothetical protein